MSAEGGAERYALGIDLGTSGVKAAVVAASGDVVSLGRAGYSVASPRPGWAETAPEEWLEATRRAVRDALADAPGCEIASIAIDGQMHGAVFVDGGGAPVRPAVLWADTRAQEVVGEWARELDGAYLADLANPLAAGMYGPLIEWVCANEPDVIERAHRVLFPKDWLRSRLVEGSLVTDPSDASASLLWDVAADGWHGGIVARRGLPGRLLPDALASDALAGGLSAELGHAWGIEEGTPVAIGCSDVAATLRGTGLGAGKTLLILGTGAQILTPGAPRLADARPRFHTFRSWDADAYAMAAITNGGLALDRVLGLLGAEWSELYAAAARVPGLATPLFLPSFTGERFLPGAAAGTAAWCPLDLATEREDLLYAALEGLAFFIALSLDGMPASEDETLYVTGGGSVQRDFLQLVSNATGRTVRALEVPHATVRGAGLLALTAAGIAASTGLPTMREPVEPVASPVLNERRTRFEGALAERARRGVFA